MALTKIPGNLIETGAITAASLDNDAVTTAKILDANITHAKLHTSMDLTGKTVTVATAAGGTNTTAAASTAFVQQELTTLIDGAPGTLDTLNELAAAINDDANYNSTLTTALATKLPLAGGTLTGLVQLNADIAVGEDYKIRSQASSGGSHLMLRSDNLGVTGNSLSLIGLNDILIGAKSNNSGTGNIYFGVGSENKTSGWTDTLTILESGNVGIGTNNPTSALVVQGAGSGGSKKNTIAFGTSGWGGPTAPNAALDGGVKLALFEGGTQKVQIGMDPNARLWLMSAGSGAQGVDIYTGASNTVAPSLRLRVDQAGLTNAYGGVSTPLVTTNDIKASGAGGVSIQTDEGTKRIEVFDNGKIAFNNLIYQSGINANTINSGYDADSEDSDMWINYRGYNDGQTRYRDFRIGDGKGNPIAFFDGSEMTANIHTLKVHTGSFRAVGTLPSTGGMGLTGVGLGQLSNYAHAQFSGSAGGYIDFAEPNVDWSGRIIYTHSDDSMVFYSNAQPTMFLYQTGAIVRNGGNANQGKLTFSTQSTAYNIIGGNYWGYTGINSGGHIRLGSNNGEQMRLGAGVSTGNMALGLINVSGVNSEAAIHGKSSDATLVVTNTDLTSASAWGWTGRGGRVLTSNGTSWATDGKDAALVIGSDQSVAATRGQGIGIALHNESNTDNTHSPGIYFTNKSNSGQYNTAYGYIMGKKTGSGVDANWSSGEIHFDTAGVKHGQSSAYMNDEPAMKIDSNGSVRTPYQPFIRARGNNASMVTNQGTNSNPFDPNWYTVTGRGITESGGVFTVPVTGTYLIVYNFYFWVNNSGNGVTHSSMLYHNSTGVQEQTYETGSASHSYLDNTKGTSFIMNMSAGDTFKFSVNADIYGGGTHTTVCAYMLG